MSIDIDPMVQELARLNAVVRAARQLLRAEKQRLQHARGSRELVALYYAMRAYDAASQPAGAR
jgi:hypothetical protein